ncbi:unnamed protein product [Dovyalis caffra]|uniref:Uncharacterized protein n=1 Tax=Dovyalis caffra TaxID=77055 RepID=A0AAV1SBY4_9ROSI|nr:unnamed protein product [Dovyalis caffra]
MNGLQNLGAHIFMGRPVFYCIIFSAINTQKEKENILQNVIQQLASFTLLFCSFYYLRPSTLPNLEGTSLAPADRKDSKCVYSDQDLTRFMEHGSLFFTNGNYAEAAYCFRDAREASLCGATSSSGYVPDHGKRRELNLAWSLMEYQQGKANILSALGETQSLDTSVGDNGLLLAKEICDAISVGTKGIDLHE